MNSDRKWWYTKVNQKYGPFNSSDLKNLVMSGEITENTPIWKDGLTAWVPAKSISGLMQVNSLPSTMPPIVIDEPPSKPSLNIIVIGSVSIVAILILLVSKHIYNSPRENDDSDISRVEAQQNVPIKEVIKEPITLATSELEAQPQEEFKKIVPKVENLIFENDQNLIMAALNEQYKGMYFEPHQCWIFASENGEQYCIKESQHKVVEAHDGKRMYLLASGVPITDDGAIENVAGHASGGLVGAFILQEQSGGRWTYLAATKDLIFGSSGESGVDRAELTKIGAADYYAWVFTSGGMWQGIIVSSYNILAPKGKNIVDISQISEISEDDQEKRNTISFDSTMPDERVFPIIVKSYKTTDTTDSDDEPSLISTFVVPFDYKEWTYKKSPP